MAMVKVPRVRFVNKKFLRKGGTWWEQKEKENTLDSRMTSKEYMKRPRVDGVARCSTVSVEEH